MGILYFTQTNMTLTESICPEKRLRSLSKAIEQKDFVRLIEAHNGLSALIGEKAKVAHKSDTLEFDGFWESSLTDTASKGMPDAEIVGFDSRSDTIDQILNVTTKPMIVDGDTGGSPAQFEYFVKRLERLGVSAVIIEDKTFPKRNSLDAGADQSLEAPRAFAQKIQRGQDVKLNDEFMIIARIESLIAGVGLKDAIDRASTYLEAGVDGIMIHSKRNDPENILAFADEYEGICDELGRRPPLVSVPTTYNLKTDSELSKAGFNVIIHANHMLRSAYLAMNDVAETILLNDRSHEADPKCAPVSAVFETVGFEHIKQQDIKYNLQPSVVIPAAGQDSDFEDTPKALLDVNGKSLLDYQLQQLRKAGLNDTTVVRGFQADKYDTDDTPIQFITNDDWEETGNLHSLLQADSAVDKAFISVFSDVIFDPNIIGILEKTADDIVLVVDNSYRYHKDDINKELDLVISKETRSRQHRSLSRSEMLEIKEIGKNLSKEVADHEFVGLAKFSNHGADILNSVYADCEANEHGSFHEAESFRKASLTDIIQEIIDRGYSVKAVEIHKGWLEIHDREDLDAARKMLAERDGVAELRK
jgi:phosphoenolpyruvate phosphomutase